MEVHAVQRESPFGHPAGHAGVRPEVIELLHDVDEREPLLVVGHRPSAERDFAPPQPPDPLHPGQARTAVPQPAGERGRLGPSGDAVLSSAPMAPHPECPHTVIEPTRSTSTAYSIAAPTESQEVSEPGGGIRLPTLRTVNRSPGPLDVIMLVTRRESAQVRNSWVGRWPSRASRASSSRTSGAVWRWNALTPPRSWLPLLSGADARSGAGRVQW